jgi:hypothetical protein
MTHYPHPVMESHFYATTGRNTMEPDSRDVMDELAGAIDNTPKFVAGLALGSLLVLVALKAAGFRFVVGVNVGK